MPEPLTLVRPEPNKDMAAELREMADEAARGDFTRIVVVKVRADKAFAVRIMGVGSDLFLAGALAFAQHDLMKSNEPE